jgi:hypothetical protein
MIIFSVLFWVQAAMKNSDENRGKKYFISNSKLQVQVLIKCKSVISVQKKSDLKRSLLNFWYGDYS